MSILPILFLLTALLYALVGFGGGSTYNALLVLSGTEYTILPTITLTCNLIVVSGGVWHYHRSGNLSLSRIAPWLVSSIPFAWLGGRLAIAETTFIGLLGLCLLFAGGHLAFDQPKNVPRQNHSHPPLPVPLVAGAGLGLLSGLVGIGGGIFLAPILYFLRWGSPTAIGAACSLFIFTNSIAGLTGQMMKIGVPDIQLIGSTYWTLFAAVFIGGQIGSRLGVNKINPILIKKLTACLILYVAIRLLWRWFIVVL